MEWDGMVRICFSRKNKTIRSLFNNKHVLEMLEKNYSTFCSLNSVTDRVPPAEFKEFVMTTLEEAGVSDLRSAKLTQDHFLSLLAAFNLKNLHFS
jgi:18S rRNA (adenine1779-N6/adenine1780-N6)-dimethyltransferase